jgi:type II secretory pathway pseudopilin PulG
MQWLKSNLILVISIVVSLALIGGSGFYFYSKISSEKEAEAQLAQLQASLQEYQNKVPSATKANVEAAQQVQKQLLEFKAKAEKFFPVLNTNKSARVDDFGAYLLSSLFNLQRDAQRASTALPTNFSFGFAAQRELLQFDTAKIPLLTLQVEDVKALCAVLYQAKVYEITQVRRAMTATQDTTGQSAQPQDYLSTRSIVTNEVVNAVISPYEITFKCSSAELAVVMEGLAHSSNGFIVKAVRVEPADIPGQEGDASDASGGGGAASFSARMAARYGLGARGGARMRPPGPGMSPSGVPAPQVKKGPGIVLNEKPLMVAVLVDAMKLSPTK